MQGTPVKSSLVAIAIVVEVVIAAVVAVTSVVATVIAVASVVAAVVAAAATAVAVASSTLVARFCFFDDNIVAVQVRVVERIDSGVRLVVIRHFDEAEATRFASKMVHDYLGAIYLAEGFKSGSQFITVGFKVEPCYKNVHYKKILKSEK